MNPTDKYHGTTLTAFAARHFPLLALLGIFLALAVWSGNLNSNAGRAITLFSFFTTLLVWIAILFQCWRARPLTPLLELFAGVMLCGWLATTALWLVQWRELLPLTLPLLLYVLLFLLYTEFRPERADGRTRGGLASRFLIRLACLLLAATLSYWLLALIS